MDMDGDTILQLGVGGIFAMMLIKEVLGFLKPMLERKFGNDEATDGKRPEPACDTECLRRVEAQVNDLHEWHSVRDQRGVFVWYAHYGNDELRLLLKTLTDHVVMQTDALKEVLRLSQEHKDQLADLVKGRDRRSGD